MKIYRAEVQKALRPDYERLAKRLSIDVEDEEAMEEIRMLTDDAFALARPAAVVNRLYVERVWEDGAAVRNDSGVSVEFHSKIAAARLGEACRLYGFVVTAGQELEEWSRKMTDPLQAYYADEIKIDIVHQASRFVRELTGKTMEGKLSSISPGSASDWPLFQQRELFRLIGDVTEAIGVSLTESCLMLPVKSVSGIVFSSEKEHVDCEYCEREECPSRRKPFNREKYEELFNGNEPERGNE